ncbi:GNAT family N-acetyltransferase [Saccharothrix sp. ST-888]|uniref:GNAT family N-acetyltransferase n=1 Tax=Saccharothrix sp. ST-888 TaxID=1427391 RepID=UPI0005ECB5B9|nr:GNAT family N-acetyltransferase [Saccharothrix sp. ST-888]KJK55477.1 acetyltransferase [Saccharothrix sp. ST-888]
MERPAEFISDDRVELRRWRAEDAEAMNRLVTESLPHLLPWMPWAAEHDFAAVADYTARSEQWWLAGEAYNYAITTGGEIVGNCTLTRQVGPGALEIGYWIHPGWAGRGLVTTAAAALVREAFALPDVERVVIRTDSANTASIAVARRLGFTEVERGPSPGGPSTPARDGVDVVWELRR